MRLRGLLQAGWPPISALILFVLLWEGVFRAEWFPPYLFPGPSKVFRALVDDWAVLQPHIASTVGIMVLGFAVGVLVGLAIAFVLYLSTFLHSALSPLLILSQNVPIVVLAPLLVVWFGFGWMPKIILLTLVCFFPVAIATLDGLARADRNMLGYMRMAGASRWDTFLKLELPWSLPAMFSGLKVSATYSVLGAVIAEWNGASKGLGVYLYLMKSGFQVDHMFVAIAFIAGLSMLMFAFVVLLERSIVRWHRDQGR